MTQQTANIQLPYLASAQAQKHVTINESLRRLDALVQLSATSATLTAQPASPADGAIYILPAGKTGSAWGAMANGALAYYRDGAWEQIIPREGWLAYAQDADQMLLYNGAAWISFGNGVTDGNKGPITVAGSAWSINANAIGSGQIASGAVTYAKLQNISASDRVLGRQSTGAGVPEEIVFTAAARALCDDVDAAAMRATLGLGTAAIANIGTSGANVPLLSNGNTFTQEQFSPAFVGQGGNYPAYRLVASGAPLDQKNWSIYHDNGTFRFAAENDARNADYIALAFERVGLTVTNIRVHASGALTPAQDNTMALGAGGNRFSEVFAGTGTINTSDAREKTALEPIHDALLRVAARIKAGIGAFQWLEAVERKGADRARIHIGVTAQAVQAAFEAEGLDPNRYALFCEDALTETVEVAPAEFNQDGELTSPARIETRPKFGADGTPLTRLGVRSDQLMWLALAAG